jgi:hypothetical protein
VHPFAGVSVEGKAWWIRTIDFAVEVERFFSANRWDEDGNAGVDALSRKGAIEEFHRYLLSLA